MKPGNRPAHSPRPLRPGAAPLTSWEEVDWPLLRKLRERFLALDTTPGTDDYWQSDREIAGYDFTFAERIGWKWDTLLEELRLRGWQPPSGPVLDWGCGSGIASRRVLSTWPEATQQLWLSDRSGRAVAFAAARARAAFPGVSVTPLSPSALPSEPPALLIISHVLNELPPGSAALERLLSIARQATSILWVEPGTSATAGRLVQIREKLLERFRPVAPCPNALRCDLLSPGNERHWCHHFARIPRETFQDAGWGRFARQMEIDLSTLPFSMLVLDQRPAPTTTAENAEHKEGNARIIGEPRFYKGFAKALACEAGKVEEVIIQKRDAPDLFKSLKKSPGSLYTWERRGEKVTSGSPIY